MRKEISFFLLTVLTPPVYGFIVNVPYNLCADNLKSNCEALHMEKLGKIDYDSGLGYFRSTSDDLCSSAQCKSSRAFIYLSNRINDPFPNHFITYESDPNQFIYIQINSNQYERVLAIKKEDKFILKYCLFISEDIVKTIDNFKNKNKNKNIEVGSLALKLFNYNKIKKVFNAKEDPSLCSELN